MSRSSAYFAWRVLLRCFDVKLIIYLNLHPFNKHFPGHSRENWIPKIPNATSLLLLSCFIKIHKDTNWHFLYKLPLLISCHLSIPEDGHCLWSGIASVFCHSCTTAAGHLGALELQEVFTLRCLLNEEWVGTWGDSTVSRRANLWMHVSTFQGTLLFSLVDLSSPFPPSATCSLI